MLYRHLWAIPYLLAGTAACSETMHDGSAGAAPQAKPATAAEDRAPGQAVAGLPFAQGRSFTSLDDYLAFLKARGAYDIPWYRQVRPGVYELVSRRRPAAGQQLFTREQLEQKFGFER